MVSECIWLLLGRFIVLHNNGIPHYIHSILFTFYCMFVLHPPATCELELHLKWQIIFSFVGWRFVYLLNNFLIEIRFVELFCWVRFNSNVKHSITSFVQCSMQWYLHCGYKASHLSQYMHYMNVNGCFLVYRVLSLDVSNWIYEVTSNLIECSKSTEWLHFQDIFIFYTELFWIHSLPCMIRGCFMLQTLLFEK